MRRGDVVAVGRPVVGEQRVAAQRKSLLGAHLRGQRIRQPARERQRQLGQLAELRGRDRLAGAIDGDEADRVQAALPQLVALNLESPAGRELAAEQEPGAGDELLGEPGLVEPESRRAPALRVDDGGLDEPQVPAARRAHLRLALDRAGDRRLLRRCAARRTPSPAPSRDARAGRTRRDPRASRSRARRAARRPSARRPGASRPRDPDDPADAIRGRLGPCQRSRPARGAES